MSVILNKKKFPSLLEANKRAGIRANEEFLGDLVQEHQLLDVLPFLKSSNGEFHTYKQAVTLGKGAWRGLNSGRKATRGTVESMTTNVQVFSAESNVSDDVLQTSDDPMDYRTTEDFLVGTGLVYQFCDALINSDGSDPFAMKGFQFYRGKLGQFCLDGGGTQTGKLTSIYLAEFGKNGVNVRYNAKLTGDKYGIGLKIKDEGKVWGEDEDGNDMAYWKRTFDLTAGLELKQDKALVRIANINPKDAFNEDLFIDAFDLLPHHGQGAVAICDRSMYTTLLKYAKGQAANTITVEQIENFGQVVKMYGIPFLADDAVGIKQKKIVA